MVNSNAKSLESKHLLAVLKFFEILLIKLK
jgi:hypothetical protein